MKNSIKVLLFLFIGIQLSFAQSEKVGINTIQPQATLHVEGDSVIFSNGTGKLTFAVSTLAQKIKSSHGIEISGEGEKVYINSGANPGEVLIGGNSSSSSSQLTINSNTKGILIPRMGSMDISSISVTAAEQGLLVYNTDNNEFQFYDGTVWIAIGGGSSKWTNDTTNSDGIYYDKNVLISNQTDVDPDNKLEIRAITERNAVSIKMDQNGTAGGVATGIYNRLNSATPTNKAGVYNKFNQFNTGTIRTTWGVLNGIDDQSISDNTIGTSNSMKNTESKSSGALMIGTENKISTQLTADTYGSKTKFNYLGAKNNSIDIGYHVDVQNIDSLQSGELYGVKVDLPNVPAGSTAKVYGIHSTVAVNDTFSRAGYFDGILEAKKGITLDMADTINTPLEGTIDYTGSDFRGYTGTVWKSLTNRNDADYDPTNELQNWSNLPGIPAQFSDGIDNVDDADADATNEKISNITLNGSILEITEGGLMQSEDLSSLGSGSDGVFENNNGVVRNTGNDATDDFVFGANELPLEGINTNDTLFFFDKAKGSFRAGRVTDNSWQPSSIGGTSFAFGTNVEANALNSVAMGSGTTASGSRSMAIGFFTTASGTHAFSSGSSNIASGGTSTAMGSNTTASGSRSTSFGDNTTASGTESTAFGYQTDASGPRSTAFGSYTDATGTGSTAFGSYTLASGFYSSSLGIGTASEDEAQVSIGKYNTLKPANSQNRLFVIGNGINFNQESDALTIYENGNATFGSDHEVQVILKEGDFNHGVINLWDGQSSSVRTIKIDAQRNNNDYAGSAITMYNGDGNATIILQAAESDSSSGKGKVTTDILEIKGGSDFAEHFDIINEESPIPGMVVSIDPNSTGKLTITNESYDKKVAGIISGANGVSTGLMMGQTGSIADGEYPIALTGRVYVYANQEGGQIHPGDLLTTSSVRGYAMKVQDYQKAQGAIIGKAMTKLDENGFVLVLVNLQ